MLPAYLKFNLGDAVRLNRIGERHFKHDNLQPVVGIVTGYAQSQYGVKIQHPGYKNPVQYWSGFWTKKGLENVNS